MTERDRERVEAMLRAAVKRLLHEPTQRAPGARRRPAPRAAARSCASCSGSRTRPATSRPAPRCTSCRPAGVRPLGAPALERPAARDARAARSRSRRRAGWPSGSAGRRRRSWRSRRPATCSARSATSRAGRARWSAALLAGEIDLAVHSAKDVPGRAARTGRRDRRGPAARRIRATCSSARRRSTPLPAGARVGTSALRRRAQLLAVRPDLEVVELRGNVDTRLRKLADGEVDALVLAAAGLARLGREDEVGAPLEDAVFVPAPGQGCLLVQARAGDARGRRALDDDDGACARCDAERDVAARLGADCHTRDRRARDAGGGVTLRAFAGLPDGAEWLRDEVARDDADARGARSPSGCSPRAPPSCSRAPRRWRDARHRLPRRRRSGRPGPPHRPRARS